MKTIDFKEIENLTTNLIIMVKIITILIIIYFIIKIIEKIKKEIKEYKIEKIEEYNINKEYEKTKTIVKKKEIDFDKEFN